MKVINEASEQFMFEYLNSSSPTGFESSGQKVWVDYMKAYSDEWHLDNYGTAYGVINPGKDYRVVIEAHADEIAWYVNYISDSGFISVIRNGGSDHLIAPSMRVTVFTENNGPVQGVFGWPAIHTRRGDKAKLTPKLENIFVDVGAKNKEEVLEMGIEVGNVITFNDELTKIKDYYVGRALDNRMGGFCIAQVARLIKENNIDLPYSLYVVNAVQEEIGLRGAQMVTDTIKPHAAIITDVCHDTCTPLIDKKIQGDIASGKGPSLAIAPPVHNNLLKLIINTAKEKEIPYQRSASSRGTGTDTDSFAYSNGGVPSSLVSLPLRYMHTTVEMAHKDDIENVSLLMYESLLKIEANHDFKYFS